MKNGAGILFTDGRKILLLKRAEGDGKNTWGLPGGGAKEGETPHDTARRETREECKLTTVPGTRWSEIKQEGHDFTWTTFLYAVEETFELKKLSDEHSSWSWFDLSEVHNVDLHPKLKDQMAEYVGAIRRRFGEKFREWLEYTQLLKNFS